jgi:hypothetical protein
VRKAPLRYPKLPTGLITRSSLKAIALYWELQPLQLGKEFWLAVAVAMIGVEVSALNHLLLDGLLIPLPKGVKARLKGD